MPQKLTPWFPATSKPRREGLYRVQDASTTCECCWIEAIWKDGDWWLYRRALGMNVRQHVRGVWRWRGLMLKANNS